MATFCHKLESLFLSERVAHTPSTSFEIWLADVFWNVERGRYRVGPRATAQVVRRCRFIVWDPRLRAKSVAIFATLNFCRWWLCPPGAAKLPPMTFWIYSAERSQGEIPTARARQLSTWCRTGMCLLLIGCGRLGYNSDAGVGPSQGQDAPDGASMQESDAATKDSAVFDGSSGRGFDASLCAELDIPTNVVAPNVTLIVDRSGSMDVAFEDTQNRWESVKEALIGTPNGLVPDLESRVRFGLTMFTEKAHRGRGAPREDTSITSQCPILELNPGELVDPAANNLQAIRQVYAPADLYRSDQTISGYVDGMLVEYKVETLWGTPTGATIHAMVDRRTTTLDTGPEVFLLATDGLPRTCDPRMNDFDTGAAEAVAAIERAHTAGITTYVLWVGDLTDPTAQGYVQSFANAGVGATTGGTAPYWVGNDTTTLRQALTSIIQQDLSCELRLEGELLDINQACSGTVRLNGAALPCGSDNGWQAIDTTTIQLRGAACTTYKTQPASQVEASFPCGVILI